MGVCICALILVACGREATLLTASPLPPNPTVDELAILIAVQQAATRVPTVTSWPTYTPTATITLTPTMTPTVILTSTMPATVTVTPPPSATSLPSNSPAALTLIASPSYTPPPSPLAVIPGAAFDASGERQDHYWLERPFPRDPTNVIRDFASRSYPYGTTGGGQFQTHYGVDIQNQLGTSILAVANGWVLYAGDDVEIQFGPKKNFYGKLVIIEHDRLAPDGRTVYSLYGHMFRVAVERGQYVTQGKKIGQVGATGVALGSHLHLEVRIDNPYDYGSTYNPDLWLRPWPRYGTLAGRVTDRDGNRVYNTVITLQSETGQIRSTYSYADDDINSDRYYGEHYTYADLPAGDYLVFVRIRGVMRFQKNITIESGKTNWLDIQLN